ncbi:MAG: amino acid ABC transporter permease [Chitinophagales bacterium]
MTGPAWLSVLVKNLPYLWGGLQLTLGLSVVSIVLSFIFGTFLGMARLARTAAVRWPATVYIELVRATPLIMVIFWIFFLLPIVTGRPIPPVQSALVAFVLFTSAYVAEIVRAGIQSVPKGQTEAALASGLSGWQVMQEVVLPQALTKMIPPLVGQFISLFKDTSLAYIIGVLELTRRATIVNNREFQSFAIFGFVAVVYFVFCYALSRSARLLEARLAAGRR